MRNASERAAHHRADEYRGEETAAGRAGSEGAGGGEQLQNEGDHQYVQRELAGERGVHRLNAGAHDSWSRQCEQADTQSA